jgi:hypothetical protein
MNGKHRARWLAEQISELQRFAKKAGAERPLVTLALARLEEARDVALGEGESENEDERGG